MLVRNLQGISKLDRFSLLNSDPNIGSRRFFSVFKKVLMTSDSLLLTLEEKQKGSVYVYFPTSAMFVRTSHRLPGISRAFSGESECYPARRGREAECEHYPSSSVRSVSSHHVKVLRSMSCRFQIHFHFWVVDGVSQGGEREGGGGGGARSKVELALL